jgi:hypothetical protein
MARGGYGITYANDHTRGIRHRYAGDGTSICGDPHGVVGGEAPISRDRNLCTREV